MSDDAKSRANQVVDSFRLELGSELCETLGEHRFHALRDMVRDALAEQSESIIARLQQDLKKYRSEMIERRALEI